MNISGISPTPTIGKALLRKIAIFCEEFERIYNNDEIPEADDEDYTPDGLDNTYWNTEVAFPRYGEGPEIARVVKSLREKDGIPIGTANYNPILESRIYEVVYPDWH